VDIIRKMGFPCLKGNHDEGCSSAAPLDGFNPREAELVQWTRKQLTADDLEWLRGLPYTLVLSGFTLVHATLNQPERWEYVFDKLAAAEHFKHQTTPVCFFGHTHVPVAFVRDTVVHGGTFSSLKVEHGRKYFVNVGSVGQPRDRSSKAAYVTYDLDKALIELRRLDYPKPDVGDRGGPGSPVRISPGDGPSPLSASNQLGTG
jgi:diadenosine tetraphosphatase ApaH/serine/threonine PP2A family protein phosphatase